MEWLRVVGVVAFVGASLVVGLRLLALSARTREAPELAIGLALVLAGGLGCALMFASARLAHEPAWVGLLGASGNLLLNVGAVSLVYFTRRVFRPESPWAGALVWATAAAAATGYVGELATSGFAARRFEGVWYWSGMAARCFAFAWAAAESLRYHTMMRRRVALGLADPLTANRFLLWGIAAGGAFSIFALIVWKVLHGVPAHPSAGVFDDASALLISALGLVAAGAMWLAFFPPAAYRQWLSSEPNGPAVASEAGG